eukprot:scaffold569_cov165-Amphora_coffeaeformis.AAC.18
MMGYHAIPTFSIQDNTNPRTQAALVADSILRVGRRKGPRTDDDGDNVPSGLRVGKDSNAQRLDEANESGWTTSVWRKTIL